MKRKRCSEEKVILIPMEPEAGAPVSGLSHRYGIAKKTICRWKSKFGGMEVSEIERLRELEQENGWLERLIAEADLDKAALK